MPMPPLFTSVRNVLRLLSILLIIVKGQIPSYGNEFDQFNRYISLANTADNLNASDLYEAYRKCEESVIPELGYRRCTCRGDIRKQQTEARLPLYRPLRNPKTPKLYLPDCKYSVLEGNSSHSFSFRIEQSECASGFALSPGGSTFEVAAVSKEFLAACRVIDGFNGFYDVSCQSVQGGGKACLDIDVWLHFEHFAAFSDLGDDDFAPMNRSIYKGQLCFPAPAATASTAATASLPPSEQAWIRPNVTFEGDRDSSSSTPYPDSNDYAWGGGTEKYFTISGMHKCLASHDICFIGESHMRYQFDVTMGRYVEKTSTSRYHGSMNVSGMSFQDCTFSARMVPLLDKISCDSQSKGRVSTYVLQTGSWDLQFFPPRGFIDSPYQGNAVIDAIKRLAARIDGKCGDDVRILWMSTMPHPWCHEGDSHCLRLANYWRNNAGINAANEHFERELKKINMKHITYVDTGAILLPRFHKREFVCVDHFLCNSPPPLGFEATPGGMALANIVLLSACRDVADRTNRTEITAVTDREEKRNNDEMKAGGGEGGLYYRNGRRYRAEDSGLFSVEQGCRREILDTETAHFLGMRSSSFQNMSDVLLSDIPLCFHPVYPSLKTYSLLQTHSSRTVFFMDGGKRRPLHSVAALLSLGLDFDNVTMILGSDMDSIPMGETIKSKADCLFCVEN